MTTMEHESFGFIRASRVHGRAELFDSAISHQNFVSITIGRAKQERRLHQTWNFTQDELITVDLSEHQFAQFITSMNSGSGSSCTLRRVGGKPIERPPQDMNTRQSFEPEMRDETEKVARLLAEGVAKLKSLADQGRATKGQLKEALGAIVDVQNQLISTLPFIMKQFAEHVEELTNRAKSDLSAHAAVLGMNGVARVATLERDGS